MGKLKYNGTQGVFEKILLVHPNVESSKDLIDKSFKITDLNPSLIKNLDYISTFWKTINLTKNNEINPKLKYPDINSELKSHSNGENVMTELPLVSETKYSILAKHFRTLPERQIEEIFKLVKAFHLLNNHYLDNNTTCIPYDHFFNHLNIIYHGYHNKQAHNEFKILESYGDDVKMHLTNPSGTVRIFEVFQQILVTNSFQGEYLFYPKLSPGAGDFIVKNNFLKSYEVGELKSGALPKNNIIKLFTKMIPQYSHLNHLHIFMDGDKNFIEKNLQDARVELPKNFQLHFMNTEEVFSELYEIKHSTDVQFDFYYSQYMQVYDYIENQKLLGNSKKPTKIFLDKMVKESNSLDNNQNINLMKFYSHFFSIYDLDWFDRINNIKNTLVDNNLEDISDMN